MGVVRWKIDGGIRLAGRVSASGSKNSALPILAASLLLDGETRLKNVPNLMDITIMVRMLNALGVDAEQQKNNTVKISNFRKIRHIAPYELVTAMRASFFVAGPILARSGMAKVPMPGGCAIGARPIDLHLKGFRALGAEVSIEHGFVQIQAKQLRAADIYLDFPSVGATENLIMAATFAKGTSIIENAALEPEISDLCHFLVAAGAEIEGIGTPTVVVTGGRHLSGVNYAIIPDRIEAGTLMLAIAMTGGEGVIDSVICDHLEPLIRKMQEAGCEVRCDDTSVFVKRSDPIQPISMETQPYPGFPTDMQSPMMALLTMSTGTSVIKETLFENRFMHAPELIRMGAQIRIDQNLALITGVPQLSGAEVKITDLRAGAALVVAGLAANGETTLHGLKHLNRGYDDLSGKLRSLGADISLLKK